MLHDLTLAIKHLRRSPLFVVVAVVTLGLGIGLTSTMLTMLDAIMHPYVPYREQDRLFNVAAYGDGGSRSISSYEKYRALVEGTTSFEIAASSLGGSVLAEAYGNATQVDLLRVSGNFFPLIGMKPEAGRFFVDGPSAPDEDKAVVSYSLWQQLLASRPLDRGVDVTVDGRTYGVIGILPPEAQNWRFAAIMVRATGFAGVTDLERRTTRPLVRMKPGVNDSMAYAELHVIEARLRAAYGEGRQKFQFRLLPWHVPPRRLSDLQVAMGGAAFAILLIACGNLANLMLVRGLNRRPELALRLALGAGRGDLVRQLFTESALVGLIGGVVGTLLAVWGVDLVRYWLPAGGRWIGFLVPHLDWRVFAFALGTTVLAVLVFGLGPAFAASDVSVTEPLKEAGSGISSGGMRRRYSVLVISEVAICLVLLMAAGLLIRTLDIYNAYRDDGEPKGLLSSTINVSRMELPTDAAATAEFSRLRDRLRNVPGVVQVATIGSGPAAGGVLTSDAEGAEPRFIIRRFYTTVSPEYLELRGHRILAGRDFSSADETGGPVAIVDEDFADRMWPGINPVGRMIKLGGPSVTAPWARVIGLIRSPRRLRDLNTPAYVTVTNPGYLYVLHTRTGARSMRVEAKITGQTAVVAMALRRKVVETFPPGRFLGGYFYDEDEYDRQSLSSFSFMTRLFSSLGGLGLLLAAVGMYGVLAYSVGRRMREFGIRIALGAERESVFRLVLHDAAVMILAGTAIGCWFAMWAGTLMVSEDNAVVPPSDWIALVSSEIVLLAVCFAACVTPAIRASRANPLDTIRAI